MMKRYTVLVDFYLYAENDEEAKRKAELRRKLIEEIDDNRASIVSMHETPFAEIGTAREVT
jgi:hypothetical protein